MYKVYNSRLDKAIDSLGLGKCMPWRKDNASEFWALRGLDLSLPSGSRLGVVGRNGAGKSTMLKLLTGNFPPTEGEIKVNGQVQALLQAGAGFHPEFTGLENIHAALTYQGRNSDEIAAAIDEIAEFTELGDFLKRPFKTYSSGMQSRLVFATATTMRPDILIVDEILGAGDAYFSNKSADRMRQLVVESGATVIVVSHSMHELQRYCKQGIWIERGRVVMQGDLLEVIKAYEQFIEKLEDRRNMARNLCHTGNVLKLGALSDTLRVRLRIEGQRGVQCKIGQVQLFKDGQVEDTLLVGDVQDTCLDASSKVLLEDLDWSRPMKSRQGHYYRALQVTENPAVPTGDLLFNSYQFDEEGAYELSVQYTCPNGGKLQLGVTRGERTCLDEGLAPTGGGWTEARFPLRLAQPVSGQAPSTEQDRAEIASGQEAALKLRRSVTRKQCTGFLQITRGAFLNEQNAESTVFKAGGRLEFELRVLALKGGEYDVRPATAIFRLDGTYVTNIVAERMRVSLTEGQELSLRMVLDPINLGDDDYVISVKLFDGLIADNHCYDFLDRSFQFKIAENDILSASVIFMHPGQWRVDGIEET
ncbi:MAG: ABC transporter ATP-binding protein [Humidesulfovibrio sp.]|nr:ABC transporter ATP-binding protein [Humidesulfovibrio sp.]